MADTLLSYPSAWFMRHMLTVATICVQVVSIAKFKDEEEAIELANDTAYGLAAGIFTKDYERAVRVTSALRAGTT